MDGRSSGEALRGSRASIVDKGWGLISQNTELLIFIAVGIMATLAEAVGYSSFIRLNDLLPPLPQLGDSYIQNENQMNKTHLIDLTNFTIIHKISEGVDTVGVYTVHISLAAHILLPYPVITETQKVLLTPWLILSLLRLVLRELVITLVGIVFCASHDVFFYPCVQYSALQGTQFCFNVYFWSSVHNFYYYLDQKNSSQDFNSVINTLNKASMNLQTLTPQLSMVLSVEEDEGDDCVEVKLVERAAMAWIAREILENGEEYVTDKQFSQYLARKAIIELRQVLKELGTKNKLRMKENRKPSPKDKIEESLEFMKYSHSVAKNMSTKQAFDQCEALSTRDPIRSIRPLPVLGKPPHAVDTMSLVSGMSAFSEVSVASAGSADAESQTEPPTHRMSKLLDILEHQQQRRLTKKMEEFQNSSSF